MSQFGYQVFIDPKTMKLWYHDPATGKSAWELSELGATGPTANSSSSSEEALGIVRTIHPKSEWNFGLAYTKEVYDRVRKIIEVVVSMLKHSVLAEGIKLYLETDKKESKDFSNLAKVPVKATGVARDLGNFIYNCIYNMMVELARGMRLDIHGRFVRLSAIWPTLSRKSAGTENSISRKGDLVEVCIALSQSEEKADEEFPKLCSIFHDEMDNIIKIMCKCDRAPTYTCLPHPFHFTRLLLFAHFSKASRSEEKCRQFEVCSHNELRLLQTRVGCVNWD